MLLLVAGLEAWLNEATLLLPAGDPPLRKLADKPIREKYYEIPERVGHGTIPLNEELKRVLEIRDEVAHFLPYVRGDPNRVPPWLSDLQQRGLFITSGSEVDFDFAVKLCSYRATYWAWDVVHKAVIDFLDAIGPAGQHLRPSAANFERYRSVCSPDKLPAYDAEHNLQ